MATIMIRLRRFFFPLLLPFTFASDFGSIASAYDYLRSGLGFCSCDFDRATLISPDFVALDRKTSEMEAISVVKFQAAALLHPKQSSSSKVWSGTNHLFFTELVQPCYNVCCLLLGMKYYL
jgi:hypothetical protein